MKLLLLLPLLLLPLATTTTPTPTTTTSKCPANLDNIYNSTTAASTGVTELGIKLLRELGTQNNILISPYSIWSVLAMVLVGAEGQTARQIADVLKLQGNKVGVLSLWRKFDDSLLTATAGDTQVSLDLANRIYISDQYNIQKCKTELSDLLVPLDLSQGIQASRTINNYVNASTNGKIKEIIRPDQLGDARMVVLNAVYFKGSWRYPFPKNETSPKPFYPSPDAQPVMVDTMFMSDVPVMYGASSEIRAQILQLPYSTGLFSLSIILPRDKGEAGFTATLNALNSKSLWAALDTLGEDTIDVQIPKFEIKSKFAEELKKALVVLGMTDAFTLAADLSSFGQDLFIKHIMHKTFLKLDEEGTEAAGVTAAAIATKIRGFVSIDRPFLFLIHSKDTIMFIGAFKNP